MNTAQTREGILCALAAYCIWGVGPTYFKYLYDIPPQEMITHRIMWSACFMLLIITLTKNWHGVKKIFQDPKKFFLLGFSASLIGGNWFLFVWVINHNHLLEASLAYFINPLINVLIGTLFLKENFRSMQWLAVFIATCGVFIQLWQFGSIPYIALIMALSFSFYGLVRKKINVDPKAGILIETLWLFPFAAFYLFGIADTPTSNLMQNPLSLNLLFMAAGILTTVPLILFIIAAVRLPLSTLGLFQYLGPTLMFMLAVGFYGEVMTPDKLITFIFIWVALIIFILDAIYRLNDDKRKCVSEKS